MRNKIVDANTKTEIQKAFKNKKIARINFCSVEKEGIPCAEVIEREIGAEVRGTLGNKKEIPKGNCAICGKKANVVVYVGKSY